MLKRFAGNLLNSLHNVEADRIRAFLSHMNDTTHLDYLESYVPGAIQLAGHGPDWRHHHRIGRDVAVPDELLEALCPGLPLLMDAFPHRLQLFHHLMLLLIQVLQPCSGSVLTMHHPLTAHCFQALSNTVQDSMPVASYAACLTVVIALIGYQTCFLQQNIAPVL